MNEEQFGRKVRRALDQGLAASPAVQARLRAAREQALARQRPEPAPLVAWADNVLGVLEGWSGVSVRVVLPLALVVAGLAGMYTWHQKQRIAEIADIDAQLLTDELPIDAYLDRGFDNWLKRRGADQ